MKEQLLQAWQTSQQKNLLLFDALSDSGMDKTMSTRGGRTIGEQWLHLHKVRASWLDICGKKLDKKLKPLDKAAKYNRKQTKALLTESAAVVEALIDWSWDHNNGKVSGFKNGLISFISYLIAHEAHHRGNMLLTLKLSGEKVEDKVKFGLWEW